MPEWGLAAVSTAVGVGVLVFRPILVDNFLAWHRRYWRRWAGPVSRTVTNVAYTGVALILILFGIADLLDLDPTIPFFVLATGMAVVGTWAQLTGKP